MATFPRYSWDPRANRYRGRTSGRFVSDAAVRRMLDAALETEQASTRALAQRLQASTLSLREWSLAMREMVKATQLYSLAAAKGGWKNLTADDLRRVEDAIARQYAYLDRFVGQIAEGLPFDGLYYDRAKQYARAGRRLFHEVETEVRQAAGDTQYRNRLHPADHCGECPDLTGRTLGGTGATLPSGAQDDGWVPIGTLPSIGDRVCRGNDLCSFEYRSEPVLNDAGILAQPVSAYPPARPGERETLNAFTTAGGQLTPERQQLHDAIVRQHFRGAEPVADPTVYVMGGGPAAGKSVMLDKLDTPSNVVTIDSDRIKTLLPEFHEGAARGDVNAATMVHEESSALAKRIVAEAASGRYHIVADGTGDNSYENLAKKVTGYRAGGAKIVANYVTVDTETAVARAHSRGVRTGRFVPETFLREVHRNISNLVPRAIRDGLFDEFTLWDNNGAAGTATIIARYTGGRLTVLDDALWQRFLLKAT